MQMSKAKMENRELPKRFYTSAEARDGQILLDGRVLKTSAKNPLYVAQHKLAVAVADEWNAQATHIDPDAMPLTRLFNIAIDRVPLDRDALIADMVRYAETDLVCYRAEHAELAALHAQHFDALLDWAKGQGVQLVTTAGMMPVPQPAASLQRMGDMLREASDHELAALALMVPLVGSAVLALAYWHEQLSTEALLAAARVDEDFQAAQWGEDDEAKLAWAFKARDVRAACFFLDMQRTEKSA